MHTAIKPYQQTFISPSSYAAVFNDTGVYYYEFTVKLFKENLLNIKEDDVFLTADPLFNLGTGRTNYTDTTTSILRIQEVFEFLGTLLQNSPLRQGIMKTSSIILNI